MPYRYGASQSHSDTPLLVGLLWTSDQPDAQSDNTQHSQAENIQIPPAVFKPQILASERPQTHDIDCATTRIYRIFTLQILPYQTNKLTFWRRNYFFDFSTLCI